MKLQEIEVGASYEGVEQHSWWLVNLVMGGKVHATCMKAPERYAWAHPGEMHVFPLDSFLEGMVKLP